MKKVITMKDIAREANVSVATVSYVINNKTNQKINEQTVKKIMQIVNLFDYVPNTRAVALATNKSRNIGLYVSHADGIFSQAQQLLVIKQLSMQLSANRYNLQYLNCHNMSRIDNVDAIVCLDVTNEFFRLVGDKNLVPLIALDCMINDRLFFQISTDLARIKQQAKLHFNSDQMTLVSLNANNSEILDYTKSQFDDVVYLSDMDNAQKFKNNLSGQNIIVIDQVVANFLQGANCNLYFDCDLAEMKIVKLLECIELATSKVTVVDHNILV